MAIFQKKRQVLELPTEQIRPNPHQPRQHFRQEGLEELAASIGQAGILQPLTVRRTGEGWELISGERRLRAARMAGLATVPCLPLEADGDSSALLALVENLQREDLNVWEEAEALRVLTERFHLSQEEAARRVGKSQSAVANKLRLLRLPPAVAELLREDLLTERHARALLRLPDPRLQRQAAEHILRHGLTVAKAEAYVERLLAPPPGRATPVYRIRDVRLFVNTVRRSLSVMQAAGVEARMDREESDSEIVLTVRIPKDRPAAEEPLSHLR